MVPEVAGSNPVAHPATGAFCGPSPEGGGLAVGGVTLPSVRVCSGWVDGCARSGYHQGFRRNQDRRRVQRGGGCLGVRRRPVPGTVAVGMGGPRDATVFDNRGHEKRAGPCTDEHCVSSVVARRGILAALGATGFTTQIPSAGSEWIRSSNGAEIFELIYNHGEFDPGSERTLAACLTHASRTRTGCLHPEPSGGRVSNT